MAENALTRAVLANIEQQVRSKLKCMQGVTIKIGDKEIRMGAMGPVRYGDTQAQVPGASTDRSTPEQDLEVTDVEDDVSDHIAPLYAPKLPNSFSDVKVVTFGDTDVDALMGKRKVKYADFTHSLESLKVQLNYFRTPAITSSPFPSQVNGLEEIEDVEDLDDVMNQECSNAPNRTRIKGVHSSSHLPLIQGQAGRLSATSDDAWEWETESQQMTAALKEASGTFPGWNTPSQELRAVLNAPSDVFQGWETQYQQRPGSWEDPVEAFTSYEIDSDEHADDDDDGEDPINEVMRANEVNSNDSIGFFYETDEDAIEADDFENDDDDDNDEEEQQISNMEKILGSGDDYQHKMKNPEEVFHDGCDDTKKSDDAQKDLLQPGGSGDKRPGLFKRMKTRIVKFGRRIKSAFSFKSTKANKRCAELMPFYSEGTIDV